MDFRQVLLLVILSLCPAVIKPAQARQLCGEAAAAARFALFVQNNMVDSALKTKLDKLFQDKEIVKSLSSIYTTKDYNNYERTAASRTLEKKNFVFLFSLKEHIFCPFEGIIMKMGLLNDKTHGPSRNIHRVLISKNVQKNPELQAVKISSVKKGFYIPPITDEPLPWAFVVATYVKGNEQGPNEKQREALIKEDMYDFVSCNYIQPKEGGPLLIIDTEPCGSKEIIYPEYWRPESSQLPSKL